MRRNPTRPLPPPALALLLLAGVAEGRLRNAKVLSREPAQAAAAEVKPATPKYSRQCALPAHLPCERPVARSPVKWSGYMERSLLGESHPPHMESGYVNVTAEDYLFYLFFGPHEAAPRDAPLVVWSNGGPGCSSMEAATTEMSPLSLFGAKTSGRQGFSHIPTTSAWAWTRHAALLFVDQPRYVGFSTGTGPYVTSSREAGKDMVTFLRAWRRLFPDQAHRSLIFASESYGGHYVPAWVAATLDANAAASRPEDALPLTGIFLGNAVVDDAVQSAPQAWSDYCLVEKIVNQDDRPDDEDSTYEDIEWYLGYQPNMYDYRLESQDGCGAFGYDYRSWAKTLNSHRYRAAFNVCGDAEVHRSFEGCNGGCHPCIGDEVPFDDDDDFDYPAALSRALNEGIRLTFVWGKRDLAVPYIGGQRMINETLKWEGAAAWRKAPLEPIYFDGTIEIGQMRRHGNLTYMQVEDAGHMVPTDQPAVGVLALKTLTNPSARVLAPLEPLNVTTRAFGAADHDGSGSLSRTEFVVRDVLSHQQVLSQQQGGDTPAPTTSPMAANVAPATGVALLPSFCALLLGLVAGAGWAPASNALRKRWGGRRCSLPSALDQPLMPSS